MSNLNDRMYQLLPAIIRQRDAEHGEPLKNLFGILASQGSLVEQDLARLYENLFIETCDEWVVPYIGNLLNVRGLNSIGGAGFSQRARVANTLSYRRRKGTASMLAQFASDATGWSASAVEFFELLSTSQWLNHIRLHSTYAPDLRDADALELIGSAFETTPHYVDVRRISRERGRYNISNVGIFLWRLQSDYLQQTNARPVPDGGVVKARGRFHIHSLGIDSPLFNWLSPSLAGTDRLIGRVSEASVPGALRRRALHDECEARRVAFVNDDDKIQGDWYGNNAVVEIQYKLNASDPSFISVKPENILIADLSEPSLAVPEVWLRPPQILTYKQKNNSATKNVDIDLAVDPVLGRIAFPSGIVPAEVRVSCAHGMPGSVGGGAYERSETLDAFDRSQIQWTARVGRDLIESDGNFKRLEDAVTAWNSVAPQTQGIIAVVDNGTYSHGGVTLKIPKGCRLLIISANVPSKTNASITDLMQSTSASGCRAHLSGNITIESGQSTELWMDGLLIEGDLLASNNNGAGLMNLKLSNITIAPRSGKLTVEDKHSSLKTVEIRRCIVAQMEILTSDIVVKVHQSIVDSSPGSVAIDVPESSVTILGSTIVGKTEVRHLDASDSLFTEKVAVERRQEGCVRFCLVPVGSLTPRKYRCQPDLALLTAGTAAEEKKVLDRMVPGFTDEVYGRPGYLQLTRSTPVEIRTGADDGSEMGAWSFLKQPQREANLQAGLDEYLRAGLDAGFIFVT